MISPLRTLPISVCSLKGKREQHEQNATRQRKHDEQITRLILNQYPKHIKNECNDRRDTNPHGVLKNGFKGVATIRNKQIPV